MTGIIYEVWRSIDGHVDYQVSNVGRVTNTNSGSIFKEQIHDNYNYQDKKAEVCLVHRLLAQGFV